VGYLVLNYKISLLMPTRDRLSVANNFIKTLERTVSVPQKIELIVYIDHDDLESNKLRSDIIPIKKYVGKKLSMGGYNTFLYEKASGDIIMLVNDDISILTLNWDQKIRDIHHKFLDQVYLAFPNDLYKKKRNAAFPIISKKTASCLVRPFPVEYSGGFIDTHLFEIFNRLKVLGFNRIIYLEEIKFEHLHFRTGKSEIDNIYMKRDRFLGDSEFHSLAKLRKKQTQLLHHKITKSKEYLEPIEKGSIQIKNFNSIDIILLYFKDTGLTFNWKIRKITYFLARLFYKKTFNRISDLKI